MKALRWLLLAGVLVLGLLLGMAFWPTTSPSIAAGAASAPDAQTVERGRYIATAGDCIACHSAPGGKPFAGGLPIASPIGTIYSTNITPDRDTGIGGYSVDDFERALRHGITRDGRSLYPAMPYPSYAKLGAADVRDMYAYFMQGVEPVAQANRAADIPWPLSMRWPLALWRKSFAPPVAEPPADAARYASSEIARGAYLVQGAGHCGSCHTPRAFTLQEKALDESNPLFLSGGPVIDGWVAVNLRGNSADGLGRWSVEDIVVALRGARTPTHAVIGGPMNDVVVHSTQHLSEADLKAVALYLKTLAPAAAEPSSFAADPAMARALAAGNEPGRGAQVYVDNCAACHRTDGKGYRNAFPAIAGNSSVLAGDPTSMIRLILAGSALPSTQTAPSNLGMPGFGWRLSDSEAAELATFIRGSWGNHAPAVDAAQVAKVRASIDSEHREAHR